MFSKKRLFISFNKLIYIEVPNHRNEKKRLYSKNAIHGKCFFSKMPYTWKLTLSKNAIRVKTLFFKHAAIYEKRLLLITLNTWKWPHSKNAPLRKRLIFKNAPFYFSTLWWTTTVVGTCWLFSASLRTDCQRIWQGKPVFCSRVFWVIPA